MIVLFLRTDGSSAYAAVSGDGKVLAEERWESGRQLARDLLGRIVSLLSSTDLTFGHINGIACFAGPGSFTSLRIGITTANTLAYANTIPIVSASGDDWISTCIDRLMVGDDERVVKPLYGSEPNITPQKK